jgi:hypothetical protein
VPFDPQIPTQEMMQNFFGSSSFTSILPLYLEHGDRLGRLLKQAKLLNAFTHQRLDDRPKGLYLAVGGYQLIACSSFGHW